MKTGIIIVNYNDYENTIKLVNNIKDYKIIDSVVVVDNKSSDNSLNQLKKLTIKKLIILELEFNSGYSGALNKGCKYLTDKYKQCNILISNSDIIINNSSDLKKLINTLNDKIVMVGPVIEEHGSLNRGWKIPTPKQDIIMNLPKIHNKYRRKHIFYDDDAYITTLTKVEAVSGCFFAVSSDHLKRINYFDDNVFLYYEENILGVKTKVLNKEIVVNNDVKIIHNHSVTIDKNINRRKKYQILKDSQYYFQKNYNNANFFELGLLKLTVFLFKLFRG